MTYTFNQAKNHAKQAKREVYDLVSIPSDFEAIPWFKVGITEKQGCELMKDCENYKDQVEQIEQRNGTTGIKINGVWFSWPTNGRAA